MKFAKREIKTIVINMLDCNNKWPIVSITAEDHETLTVYAHEDKYNAGQVFCVECVNKLTGEVTTHQYRLSPDQSHQVVIKEILLVEVAEKMQCLL